MHGNCSCLSSSSSSRNARLLKLSAPAWEISCCIVAPLSETGKRLRKSAKSNCKPCVVATMAKLANAHSLASD